MNNKPLILSLFICVALGLVMSSAEAQNKRTGTAGAQELLIPIGARDLALGGASIATSSGVEAIYWNPAGLSRLQGAAEGMFSSMTWIADINVNYGGVAASFGTFGVLGLSVKSLSFGDIPLTTNDDPENEIGRFYSPTFVTLGLTYSRALTDAISAGVTVKVISEQIDRVSASGIAFDIGVQYKGLIGISNLSLGVTVKNIGPQMKFDGPGFYKMAQAADDRRPQQRYRSESSAFELPSLIEIGIGYDAKFGDNLLYGVSSSFTNNNLYLDEYRLGGEIGYKLESLQLMGRAGYSAVPQADENIFGASFGAGISYAAPGISITIDYAYRQVDFFDANQVVSLKLGF